MISVLLHIPIHTLFIQALESCYAQKTDGIALDIITTLYDPEPPNLFGENIAFKMNKARAIAIALDYDYLFNVEQDIIIPPDATIRLVKAEKNIISGLYRLRPSRVPSASLMVRVWDVPGPQDSDDRPAVPGKDFKFGYIFTATAIGFGCILIHRTALKKLPFDAGIDTTFSKNAYQSGFSLFCHSGVVCKHIDTNGKIISV